MNKKVMALAIASVLTAPAVLAQTSNVTLYGRANLGFDNYRAEGATAGQGANFKPRNGVYDAGSRLGVRGIEDLGKGIRAVFQIESGVNIDAGTNTGQSGSQNASTGFLASRDSFVGLDTAGGRLTFGRQSIFWVSGTIIQTGANYVNAEIPWLNGASAGRVVGPAARTSNVLLYTSPTWGGFNFSAGYVPQSETARTANTPINGSGVFNGYTGGKIYGATLRWAGGPIALQGDHWRNNGSVNASYNNAGAYLGGGTTFGGVNASSITGTKLLAGWSYIPGAQLSLVGVQNRNYDSSQFGGSSVRQNIWGVSWEHTFGRVQALAQFSKALKVSGCQGPITCDQTGSTGYMAGARYLMSKRTWLYASANWVNNNANAAADYTGGNITPAAGGTNQFGNAGFPVTTTVSYGADPRLYAVGIFHQF